MIRSIIYHCRCYSTQRPTLGAIPISVATQVPIAAKNILFPPNPPGESTSHTHRDLGFAISISFFFYTQVHPPKPHGYVDLRKGAGGGGRGGFDRYIHIYTYISSISSIWSLGLLKGGGGSFFRRCGAMVKHTPKGSFELVLIDAC